MHGLRLGFRRQASRQGRRSADALLEERKTAFKIDVLTKLLGLNDQDSSMFGGDRRMRTLVVMLPSTEVALLRATLGLPENPHLLQLVKEREKRDQTVGRRGSRVDRHKDEIAAQLGEAIRTRV